MIDFGRTKSMAALPRQEAQLKLVIEQARAMGIELEVERLAPNEPLVNVYEKNRILVREEDADALVGHLDNDLVPHGGVGDVQLRAFGDGTVKETINRLGRDLRLQGIAPNHLVSVCPLNMCPADEPVPPPRLPPPLPFPPVSARNGGEDVRIDVVDTGLMQLDARHTWMADVPHSAGGTLNTVRGRPNRGIRQQIMEYAGHGTFIAGVLRCVAPQVSVYVDNALQFAGATLENALGRALLERLAWQPDIISLSAGGPTIEDRGHLGLEPFFAALGSEHCTTLLVAAAGNDGVTRPFWPAAYAADRPDAVIAVGALRADLAGRACFSNHGEWVSVYAAGERLVNAFPSGKYQYLDPTTTNCRNSTPPLYAGCTCLGTPAPGQFVNFTGMAQWSGTSFSTPLVAGRIARHMTETGQPNARLAALDLLATRTQTVVEAGVPLPVLL